MVFCREKYFLDQENCLIQYLFHPFWAEKRLLESMRDAYRVSRMIKEIKFVAAQPRELFN